MSVVSIDVTYPLRMMEGGLFEVPIHQSYFASAYGSDAFQCLFVYEY